MTIQFGLNIVTLVMCIITLTLATAALMPQIKTGLRMLRDGLLWSLLLGIVAFVGVVGWTRLHEVRQQRSGNSETTVDVLSYPAPSVAPTKTPMDESALQTSPLNYQVQTEYSGSQQHRSNRNRQQTARRIDPQQQVRYKPRYQASDY